MSVSLIALGTATFESTFSVCAEFGAGAIVTLVSAFIDVHTLEPIARISRQAFALKGPRFIGALGKFRAVVAVRGAFVDLDT